MPIQHKATQGQLYEQAAQFAADLEAGQVGASDQILAGWTDAYWATRQEIDGFLSKVEAAKAAGTPPSPAWAYQQQRLKSVLDTTKVQMARYAVYASEVTEQAQKAAIAAGTKHAAKLGATAVAEQLPNVVASFVDVNPAVLEAGIGFLADGSPLKAHLAATMPAQAAAQVRDALTQGLALGKGQEWMIRRATHGLALSRTRAETIMRTESLRAYRHATRATYIANQDVLGTWVWNAHLDARTCIACALQDGTEHPLESVLDGHPRCRCAMVPRTKTWDQIAGKPTGAPDTRPPIRSGKAWLEAQPAHVQRAMMGPAKFNAWTEGLIGLDDMVGRTYDPVWGTMRAERSLKAIAEDRNANWVDEPTTPTPPTPPQGPPAPQKRVVKQLVAENTVADLEEWVTDYQGPEGQAFANLKAALAYAKNRGPVQGPRMPKPDQAKVDKALAKLEAAVETKGYPSKGYSQVKAIYKAQANGTPGAQVGVVKSLTWEQKITAAKIVEEHDAALPGIIAQAEAKAAANAKALQGKIDQAAEVARNAAHNAIHNATEHATAKAALNDLLDQYHTDAMEVMDTHGGGDGLKIVAAARKAVLAVDEAYDDARVFMAGHKGTDWENDQGAEYAHVDPDGWVTVQAPHGDDTWSPLKAQAVLFDTDSPWTQVLTPDDAGVNFILGEMKGGGGLIQADKYEEYAAIHAKAIYPPQDQVDLTEALALAWNVEKWVPEPTYVTSLKAHLASGLPEADLRAIALAPDAKPLTKANIYQALQEWKAEKAAAAAVPTPKPIIDPAKVNWTKASDAQVQKLVDQVNGPGPVTVDDLYAKYQASKNSGPKANYAKAIFTLEHNLDAIPSDSLVDPKLWATWMDDLAKGNIELEELDDLIGWSGSTATDVATAKAVKADWAAQTKANPYGTPDPAMMAAYSHSSEADLDVLLASKWTADGTKAAVWELKATNYPPKAPAAPTVAPAPTPTLAMPHTPPWKPEDLTFTGQVLGTHGAKVYTDPSGTRWLFKPPKDPKDGFLTTLDEAASRLQAQVGLKAPDTFVTTLDGKRGSIQRMFDSTDGFPSGFKPTALNEADLEAVQRQHVLDWLISNHDGHRDQFLRLPDGTMVGIDKGQAFRWFGQDKLDWTFHPNAHYGAPEPVYNALWRSFAEGGDVDLTPPNTGALARAIQDVQAISDADLRALMRPYAEEAAARGKLALRQGTFPGVGKPTIPANDVEAFLDALVARKNGIAADFQDLYDKAAKARAKALPGWKPKAPPKATAKAKKWVGKDKPEPPPPPTAPTAATTPLFDSWLDAAKGRYATFSGGKSLEASQNWARFRRVVDDLDTGAVAELKARHYLDDDTAAEALALITKAKAERATLEAGHKAAQVAHAKAMKGYQKDLGDWRTANGIVNLLQGMDTAALRHNSNAAGTKWAGSRFKEAAFTPTQRKWLRSYTGSDHHSWNSHLRKTDGKPTQYLETIRHIDEAMEAQPIPEDVILHRGVGTVEDTFDMGGGLRSNANSDLTKLIGSVQKDEAYMSTSVGNEAAFNSHPVQLKIRAPAGTKGAYVKAFSQFSTERELILGRGQRFYVHNAYRVGHRWFMEVEVVDADFDPATATPQPSTKPWSQ